MLRCYAVQSRVSRRRVLRSLAAQLSPSTSRSFSWSTKHDDANLRRSSAQPKAWYSLAPAEVKDLPRHARVVICGGGVIGCSVAYHLAKFGYKDVVLLEQGSVSCGTTWHAAGLIGKLRNTSVETQLSDYGKQLYVALEEETGQATGLKNCGSILLARTRERAQYIRRIVGRAKLLNVDVEMISPREAQALWPHMHVDDIEAALWSPEDAVATSSDLCNALARGATMHGAKIFQNVTVDRVLTKNHSVCGVETNNGAIDCEVFVNCAGMWSRHIGLEKSTPQVHIPLHAAEHYYIVTKPIKDLDPMLPVLRDPDGRIYAREWSGGLLAGGFEPNAKPIFGKGIPKPFEYQLLPEDWDQFEPLLVEMLHRVPELQNTEIRQLLNGPESFTPDGHYVLGEAPQINKYFVAAGMNSSGIAGAGGVGKALAEWIINGEQTMDLSGLDIKRFSKHHNDLKFLHDRITETLSFHYKLHFPLEESDSSRNVLCTSLHPLLDEAGASWGQKMCWERPNWFALNKEDNRHNVGTFGVPNWFPSVDKECDACTNAVGVADMSSMAKFMLESVDESSCLAHLQYLCACNVDIPIGSLLCTAMLNQNGKYEGDCTVARLATNRFLLVTSSSLGVRLEHKLAHQFEQDRNTFLHDVTNWGYLNIIGPNAEALLSSAFLLSQQTFSEMECNTFKEMDLLPLCRVLLLKKGNRSGEDIRWQILSAWSDTPLIYEQLMSKGEQHGVTNVGCYALESLRVENGYPKFGLELTPATSPHELGYLFVDVGKVEEYEGQKAVQENQQLPSKSLLKVTILNHDEDNLPWGGEPVLCNQTIVGSLSSASFSHTDNKPIALSLVRIPPQKITGTEKFEVQIAGKVYSANVTLV